MYEKIKKDITKKQVATLNNIEHLNFLFFLFISLRFPPQKGSHPPIIFCKNRQQKKQQQNDCKSHDNNRNIFCKYLTFGMFLLFSSAYIHDNLSMKIGFLSNYSTTFLKKQERQPLRFILFAV